MGGSGLQVHEHPCGTRRGCSGVSAQVERGSGDQVRIRRLPALRRTDGPSGSSRRSRPGIPSKGSSSSRSATPKGSTSGFPRGIAPSPSPTSPLATLPSSPTASTQTHAAGRSSPSTGPKSCCGSRIWGRRSCVGHSGRCRDYHKASYGQSSTRPSGVSSGPLAHGRPRALIQMATGSGKTFMAVSACHRLIKHANAKRILFLVDRNNLGRQTLNEFQQFRDPASPYTFADEFPVSAPARQRHRTGQQGCHHNHPAPVLDTEGRSRVRPGQRGRIDVRVRRPAWQ